MLSWIINIYVYVIILIKRVTIIKYLNNKILNNKADMW